MRAINSVATIDGKPVTIERLLGGDDYLVRDAAGKRWAIEGRALSSVDPPRGAPAGFVAKGHGRVVGPEIQGELIAGSSIQADDPG